MGRMITPGDLAAQLGRDPKEVRRAIRSKFGRVGRGGRWELTEEQAQEIRDYLNRDNEGSNFSRTPRAEGSSEMVRRVIAFGNSLAVTLPAELTEAYGIERGRLVEVEPTTHGILVKPVKIVSALNPEGSALINDIIRRYRRALDVLARGDKEGANR